MNRLFSPKGKYNLWLLLVVGVVTLVLVAAVVWADGQEFLRSRSGRPNNSRTGGARSLGLVAGDPRDSATASVSYIDADLCFDIGPPLSGVQCGLHWRTIRVLPG